MQGTPVGSGQLDAPLGRDRAIGRPVTASKLAALKVADLTSFWPSREQQQQLLQAQLAAAAVQQETQQRLQKARDVLVSAARPKIWSMSIHIIPMHMDHHLSCPA